MMYKSNSHTSTLEKLLSFKVLPTGWLFGRGEAISQVATEDAKAILRYGHGYGFPASDVFPGADGEVMVTFYQDSRHYVQVTIESPNVFEVVYEVDDDERLSRDCANVAEVGQLLSNIYGEICRTKKSALPLTLTATSTTQWTDSWISHLNHLEMEAEYPCLRKNVQLEEAVPFVIICRSSTQASPVLPEHIGDSTRHHFLVAQAS